MAGGDRGRGGRLNQIAIEQHDKGASRIAVKIVFGGIGFCEGVWGYVYGPGFMGFRRISTEGFGRICCTERTWGRQNLGLTSMAERCVQGNIEGGLHPRRRQGRFAYV